MNEKERSLFSNFCRAITSELVPYLDRCLEAIFPCSALGSLTSRGSLRLDVEQIAKPLLPMLPQEASGAVQDTQPFSVEPPGAAQTTEQDIDSRPASTENWQTNQHGRTVKEQTIALERDSETTNSSPERISTDKNK